MNNRRKGMWNNLAEVTDIIHLHLQPILVEPILVLAEQCQSALLRYNRDHWQSFSTHQLINSTTFSQQLPDKMALIAFFTAPFAVCFRKGLVGGAKSSFFHFTITLLSVQGEEIHSCTLSD